MKTKRRRIGDFGERIAEIFLKKHGFSIIDRNYLRKTGEIDIIAEKSGVTHFIEVKSIRMVNHETSYRPEENIHSEKLRRIHRTIQIYRSEHNELSSWQIDIIAVELFQDTKKAKVRFIPDIVL